MLSYAFLLAGHYRLEQCGLEQVELLENETLKLELDSGIELRLKLPQQQLSEGYSRYCEALERYRVSQLVLGLPLNLEQDFDIAVGRLALRDFLEKSIKNAYVKGSRVYAFVGGVLSSWPLDKAPEYGSLLAARCIEEGYVFEEVRGKHFKVQCPSGLIRVVTLGSCDCRQEPFNKDIYCQHNAAVKALHALRANPYVKQIIRITHD